jgi:hypothetical protein
VSVVAIVVSETDSLLWNTRQLPYERGCI